MGDENRLNEHPVGGIERLNGAVVVRLVGELDLYNAPEVRVALLKVCAEQPERLVVDLGEVDFVDSTALGVLIEARTKLDEPPVVPARIARARDPPRAHDLRPRPASLRARHRRVGARGLARRLMLAELSATALLLSGSRGAESARRERPRTASPPTSTATRNGRG